MSKRLVVDLSEADDYTEAYHLRCLIRSMFTCLDDDIADQFQIEYEERLDALRKKNIAVATGVEIYSIDVMMYLLEVTHPHYGPYMDEEDIPKGHYVEPDPNATESRSASISSIRGFSPEELRTLDD